jgi:hypothetical protein
VHLNVERGLERMRKWGTRVVEASEVGSVNGSTRKEGWRKRGKGLSGALEQWSSGRIVTPDKISTEACSFNDFIWATFAIR